MKIFDGWGRYIDLDPWVLRRLPGFRAGVGARLVDFYIRYDDALIRFLRVHGQTMLRFALAIIFIWFGVLKVIDRSPVAELVAETIPWLPGTAFMRFLGFWEIVIGIGFARGVARIQVVFFLVQMLGTFLVLVQKPSEAFLDGNPLLLTILGEFVVKNLVLIAAGLQIVSSIRTHNEGERMGEDLYVDAEAPLTVVVLGGEVEVQALGEKVSLKLPPLTQNASRFRLTGLGMPKPHAPDSRGDLYARVVVRMPETLDKRSRSLFEELKKLGL